MSSKQLSGTNPLQYFQNFPEKFKELKDKYKGVVDEALSAKTVTFEETCMDLAYCKCLIAAVEQARAVKSGTCLEHAILDAREAQKAANNQQQETNKIINNLYGVDSDEELDDLLEEH